MAHQEWYGDDHSRPFEEPPAHVFRMGPGNLKPNEPGYFAGEAGVGLRLRKVTEQANNGSTRSPWSSTLDQRKALAVAMGYEADVEWWNFSRGPDGKAASSKDFEEFVWGAWWWRRIYVADKYRSWKDGGGEGDFREPDPCLPPKLNMRLEGWTLLEGTDTDKGTGNSVNARPKFVTVQAFSKHKEDGLLTDERAACLARALGDENYEWWKGMI